MTAGACAHDFVLAGQLVRMADNEGAMNRAPT
jgi:hypothetical protein